MTSTTTTTEEIINGVRVVITEVKTKDGVLRTYKGLREALGRPYENLSNEEILRQARERNRAILRDNKELIERFVS